MYLVEKKNKNTQQSLELKVADFILFHVHSALMNMSSENNATHSLYSLFTEVNR